MPPRTAALLLTATALALTGCGSDAGTQPRTPAPRTAAESPEDVVRAYLDAVQRGDDAAAAAVSTPAYAAGDTWQHGADPGLRDVRVDPAAPYDTRWSGPELQAYEQVAQVPVTFTVTDPDQGFSTDGPSGWGYVLVRHDDAQPWSIAEAGNG